MIAKFHSAPGHSMETTLTINIPPPERIRVAKGERLTRSHKDKDKGEALRGPPGRLKEIEIEDGNTMREKEEQRVKKDDERERERERRALAERGTSYKDKFQKTREKYDKVTSAHETHLQELDILNVKIRKLQAENDLLLDAVFLADTALYDRYFPSGPGFGPPPIGHPGSQQYPHQPPGISSSQDSYHSRKPGYGEYAQHPNDLLMGGPLQHFSTTSRFIDKPIASSSGLSPKPGPYHYNQRSHRQSVDPQEQSNPQSFYSYPSREAVLPEPVAPPTRRYSQRSTYRHYVPPTSDHHGMPPPPPPISGNDSEQERQREKEWESRARREWERENEGPHPFNKEFDELPPNPPAVGLTHSNGHDLMAPNGHGYVPGSEYSHSLPPPPSARTHTRHGSRASRSNSSRSVSRRRNEGMMDVDADMPLPAPSPDVDRSLGGPVHLDVDLEVSRERERGNHGRSVDQDQMGEEISVGGGRRSRRNSESRMLAPMGILEPGVSERLQPIFDRRHDERRQSPGGGREEYSERPFTVGAIRSSYESHSESGSEDEAYEVYYQPIRQPDRGDRWGASDRRIENSREEEEEQDEEEDERSGWKRREVMDVDEAN